MTSDTATTGIPLWLLIEEKILRLSDSDLSEGAKEATVHKIAKELDDLGENVSLTGGHLLQLRWAIEDRIKVGRPLLRDLQDARSALTLDGAMNTLAATSKLVTEVGQTWPRLLDSARKGEILQMVEETKLDLLITKARTEADEQGIRYLIGHEVAQATIIAALGITQERFDEVQAAVDAEKAEKKRVLGLLKEVEGRSDQERAKHLISHETADDLIVELTGMSPDLVAAAREALQEELEEKQRLAEEEAARKKAEAEGPALDQIPADQMLEYIESIREILEFSDKEAEIRAMCDQSSIPKSLVDVVVSDPGKLDELEAQAGG